MIQYLIRLTLNIGGEPEIVEMQREVLSKVRVQ